MTTDAQRLEAFHPYFSGPDAPNDMVQEIFRFYQTVEMPEVQDFLLDLTLVVDERGADAYDSLGDWDEQMGEMCADVKRRIREFLEENEEIMYPEGRNDD